MLDHVEFSLGLLAAYERLVGDDDEDLEAVDDGEGAVGPGDLVI